METESSVEVTDGPPVVHAVKVLDSEVNAADNENFVADVEENASQGASTSQSSLSKFSTTVANKSNKSTLGAANMSKEKQQSKPKTRVVQSRFRSGLSNSKNNSSNSRSGLSGNDSSSSSKNNLNTTMSGSASLSETTRNKVGRGSSSQKSGVGRSMNNIARTTESTMRSTVSGPSKPRPARSALNLNESKLYGGGAMKSKSAASCNSKLHSTVLAERTMLGNTQSVFSTTLVGGVEPGKTSVIGPKGCDVTNHAILELPELPDISAIRLDSSGGEKSEITILSAGEKDSSEDSCIGSSKEVTYEDLSKEYLRYLQAAYIDVVTEEAFDRQLEDLKTQLVFLDQLTNEKQAEVTERKQKFELLLHYQKVVQTHAEQTDLLRKLSDSLPDCECALEVLTKECEKNLHQVKMDNLYMPTNHAAYRDQLSEALKDMTKSLCELECLLEPRFNQLTSTISLFDDLKTNSHLAQQYEREVNQAARLAIQEASIQIVTKRTD